MVLNSFVQGTQQLSYSGSNCIRNDYFHNDCHICVDLCPKEAFEIVRNRLGFIESKCIECAACIGSCPTEALHLKSFDPNAFVQSRLQADTLTCKKNTPCLAVFDRHHFITMALEHDLTLDLSHCADCPLNVNRTIQSVIQREIDGARHFLEDVAPQPQIHVLYEPAEPTENSRRMIFRSAVEKIKEGASGEGQPDMALTRAHQKSNSSHEPLKHIGLKAAIRKHITRFERTKRSSEEGLFFDKAVTFEACSNCGDCIQFCPTDALKATSDKHGILFQAGACIGCGICEHICKTDAIYSPDHYDLVEAVFERSKVLVHYEMVMCQECRCPYPYRGGEPICDRCRDFAKDFDSMFKLARDF
ncbi:MAG: 4Fe-4S binding protein [Campylobacterales bacterium]|nr:4Fe-4S binding protein [Campylobacterales bacterium]